MGYNDWSDDESASHNHTRDKFRHERSSVERDRGYGNDEYDRYDRKKRGRRSPTPPEERRQYKRRPSHSPPPMRNYQRMNYRDVRNDPQTDHYIPDYERDGYAPAPRYGGKPDFMPPFPGAGPPGPAGFPMMDMMMNPTWPGAVARFNNNIDPNTLDYLVPFKQFNEFTRRNSHKRIDDEDMQARYAHYKERFSSRQFAAFFVSNKDKEWFLEKYHPTKSVPRFQVTKDRRIRHLDTFLENLKNGDYDDIKFDKTKQEDAEKKDDVKAEEEKKKVEEDAVVLAADANANAVTKVDENEDYESCLVIKTVPPTIAREKIIEMCSKVEGFDYLALSEPSPNRKFHRIGWICFKEGSDIKKAFTQLDNQKVEDFVFHLAMNRKNTPQSRVPRIAPDITNNSDRLKKDLEQAKELAMALESILGEDIPDGLKAVEVHTQKIISDYKPKVMTEKEGGEDGEEGAAKEDEEDREVWSLKKKLDMIIIYLRRVHMYCYYCGLECDSHEELNKKCFEPHCRALPGTSIDESAIVATVGSDPKQAAKNERGVAQWAKNLDHKISLKTHTPTDRELKKLGGRVLQGEIDGYIKDHVLKEHESKFKCRVDGCTKAFKGYDYVEKHILSKHPEEIERIKNDVEYYNNYVCDPNHIVPPSNPPTVMNPLATATAPPFMMRPMPMMVNPTPWEQIPRVGFGIDNAPSGWSTAVNAARRTRAAAPVGMDLDAAMPQDPRQVKSYVDLDAPVEGDSNISFY